MRASPTRLLRVGDDARKPCRPPDQNAGETKAELPAASLPLKVAYTDPHMRGVFASFQFWSLPAVMLLFCLGSGASVSLQAAEPATARILSVYDGDATQSFVPDAAVVRRMVDQGVEGIAGTNNLTAAWRRFIKPLDVVGFRVVSAPGNISGTRPAVVEALVASLLSCGHTPSRIVLWDKRASDMILAGYPKMAERLGVRWAATEEHGWEEGRYYDNATIGRLLIGDLEFSKRDQSQVGRKSFVSRLLTRDVTKIILITPLLSHSMLGVNGQVANLSLGAVDNTMRFEQDAGRLAEALPELCALDELFPRLAFGVTDALVCQYRGEERTYLHYALTLNQLRFSTDPVALDALSIDDIRKARATNPTEGEKPFKTELYNNCALIDMGVADLERIKVSKVTLAAPR